MTATAGSSLTSAAQLHGAINEMLVDNAVPHVNNIVGLNAGDQCIEKQHVQLIIRYIRKLKLW
jgi:hypothetical protein